MISFRRTLAATVFIGVLSSAVFAQTAPATAGPVTTDTDIIRALNLDAPGLENVKRAALSGDVAATKQTYIDYRRHGADAKWRIMPGDEPVKATATDDPEGDLIINHQLTSPPHMGLPKIVDMGRDFNWLYNPLSPTDPYYSDEWTFGPVGRMPFWEKLADAYWKTHDEKYAAAWVDQLSDFARKNPVPPETKDLYFSATNQKPLLWRSLDVGIRMNEAWPYAYFHFLNSQSFTAEAQWTYLKLIYEHGVRLRAGLADAGRTGNHVTAELFGLYTLSVLFPELHDASDWRQFCMDRLGKELDRMLPPDGFESELSPGYHTVALDEFQGPLELAKLNNYPVPDALQNKILAMYRALVLVMDQSGHDVAVNDSWDVNAISQAKKGLKLAQDPLLLWAVSGGKQGSSPAYSTMLPYAGFYTMRGGWKPDDTFLFFRGGPTGIGHQHEDMLQIVMRAWNKTLLLDPGTYNYDHSEDRHYVLGTSSHNTVIVDGNWQHRGQSRPFPPALSNPWVTTPLFDFVAATYDSGYQKNEISTQGYYPINWLGEADKSVSHTRRVLFLRPYYAVVLDTLDGTGHHVFDAHFHLDAPSARVDPATQAAFGGRTDNVNLALYPLDRQHLVTDIVQGQKNPMLGWVPNEHRAIPTVRFRKSQNAPATFATFLYPYQGQADADFDAKPLAFQGRGFWGQAVDSAHEQAEIVLAKDGKTGKLALDSDLLGKVHAETAGLVVRRPIGKSDVFIGGWGVQTYADDTLGFSLESPETLIVFKPTSGAPVFFNGQNSDIKILVTHPFKTTATLAYGVWTEVTGTGAKPVGSPALF